MSNKIAKGTGLPKKSGGGGNRKYNNMPEDERPTRPFSGSVSDRVNGQLKLLKSKGFTPIEINKVVLTALFEAKRASNVD